MQHHQRFAKRVLGYEYVYEHRPLCHGYDRQKCCGSIPVLIILFELDMLLSAKEGMTVLLLVQPAVHAQLLIRRAGRSASFAGMCIRSDHKRNVRLIRVHNAIATNTLPRTCRFTDAAASALPSKMHHADGSILRRMHLQRAIRTYLCANTASLACIAEYRRRPSD